MKLVQIIAAVLAVAFSFYGILSAAAQDKRKQAVTDAAQADGDFAFQGEYFGNVIDAGGNTIGIQVIALGQRQFEAVLLRGGLPGAGWDRAKKRKLTGKLDGGVVRFQSGTLAVDVREHEAIVRGKQGRLLARLEKIYRGSPTLGAPAPYGAVVLFGGSPSDRLEKHKVSGDGLLMAGTTTKMKVRDFRLHLEFRTPYMPHARGQQRGNSGVYIQRRYEVQILDSFGLDGVANECSGLYRQRKPDVNMCLPPLSWQTYDIFFTAARFSDDGKKKVANARITVIHNGVAVHDGVEIIGKTGAGRPEGPQAMPIHLQYHGNPVQYRNIWIVPGSGRPSHGLISDYFFCPANGW